MTKKIILKVKKFPFSLSRFRTLFMTIFFIWSFTLLSTFSSSAIKIITNGECAIPERTISYDDNTICVKYSVSEISKFTVGGDADSTYFSLPGFGFCDEPGMPLLPMRIDSFRIPEGFYVSLSYSKSGNTDIICNHIGVAEPETDSPTSYTPNRQITPFSGTFPAASVSIINEYSSLGERIVEVAVSPIEYCYSTNTTSISENIEYKLCFLPEDPDAYGNGEPEVDGLDGPGWIVTANRFIPNSLISKPSTSPLLTPTDEFDGMEGYLIVTTNKYIDQVRSFETWKNRLGFNTIILSQNQWSNSNEVKNAIRGARMDYPFIKYILIVGDHEDVPAEISKTYRYHITDSKYATPDDSTYIPDVYLGRIPVNNSKEAQEVLTKIGRLEMCPITTPEYYERAMHCASFEGDSIKTTRDTRRFIETSELIRDNVIKKGKSITRRYDCNSYTTTPLYYNNIYSSGKLLPQDLTYGFNWHYTNSDIASDLNDSIFYAFYRGHGNKLGWKNFRISDFDKLKSNEHPTTIFSIACQNGTFDDKIHTDADKSYEYSAGECFAETILKIPDGGASAVITATQSSLTYHNDCLAAGIFDAIWPDSGIIPKFKDTKNSDFWTPDPTMRLGQILAQGLFRMNEQYVSSSKTYIKYQYEIFSLFGDPSMFFFTETPTPFKNVEISYGKDRVEVFTEDNFATIGFYNEATGERRRYYGKEAYFYTEYPEATEVSITAPNKLPYLSYFVDPLDDTEFRPQISKCILKNFNTASVEITPSAIASPMQLVVTDIAGTIVNITNINSNNPDLALDLHLGDKKGIFFILLKENGAIIDSKKIIK
ncbi:MAG: hypothetical protein HDS70_06295 [Bacteroidales bacterium]|nr:hypothetical protein [Bacteroidales bacterium]MBD5221956.1 hypothetical protein [Bacteroidales bacterium]